MNTVFKRTIMSAFIGSAVALTGCSTNDSADDYEMVSMKKDAETYNASADKSAVVSVETEDSVSEMESTNAYESAPSESQSPSIDIDSRTVHFAFDSAELSSEAMSVLDGLAEKLSDVDQSLEIQLAGHTDAIGPSAYNRALSEDRAESVKSYLSSKGFSNVTFETEAYGEAQPVATNETPSGRQENRRVVIQPDEDMMNQYSMK